MTVKGTNSFHRWRCRLQGTKLVYGLRNDRLLHVSEVAGGLDCDCTCPHCSAPLVAKKGAINQHHFSHHKTDPCALAVESSLHRAAKQVLADAKKIHLPEVQVIFEGYNSGLLIAEKKYYPIDDVRLEQRSADIIPDVTVIIAGRPLLIEVHVTHKVSAEKLGKIVEQGISAIEIDLSEHSRDLSWSTIEAIVVGDSPFKKWIYNQRSERIRSTVIKQSEAMPVIQRRYADHVDYCPIGAQRYRGKPYANVMDDCIYCVHFLQKVSHPEAVLCMGHSPSWRDNFKAAPAVEPE